MSRIDGYLKQQMQQSTKQTVEKDIFLGHSPNEIIYFITIHELLRSPDQLCHKLKDQISERDAKVVINGNIYDHALIKVLKAVIELKADYSVIVRDGFREYNKNLRSSEQVGLLVVKSAK